MIDALIRILSVILVVVIPAAVFVLAVRARSVRQRRIEVEWLRHQVGRALDQLSSQDTEEVLAGLQTLAFVNDSVTRTVARPMVDKLTHSEDVRIAQQAAATLTRITDDETVRRNPRGLTLV